MKPFIMRELVRNGYSPLEAEENIRSKTPSASRALDVAIKSRPVLLNRAPSLHKFSIMAFMPKKISGEAIKIPPLVTKGFNADFDGDTMSVHVPITNQAVEEAKGMFPSRNLFSTSKKLMTAPDQESQIGLYLFTKKGKKVDRAFKSEQDALEAYNDGEIIETDIITVDGKETTIGRLTINRLLPDNLKGDYLLDKKTTINILSTIARKDPRNAPAIIDTMKNIGNSAAYQGGFSIGLSDLEVDRSVRDAAFRKADQNVIKIRGMKINDEQKRERISAEYSKVTETIIDSAKRDLSKVDNSFFTMVNSGAKGNYSQLQQILYAVSDQE